MIVNKSTDLKGSDWDLFRKWTATNLFIMPLLGIKRADLRDNGIINAYLSDKVKDIEYSNAVYILFKPISQEVFNMFVDAERGRKALIIDEYDYEAGYTMLVYQYDEKWQEDIKAISKGKFSILSEEYKNAIGKTVKMANGKEELKTQHKIIRKVPELAEYWKKEFNLDLNYKEDEFWHFYEEREIFTGLNKLI